MDRDGVIIENRDDYVRSWADVALYPQALTALEKICQSSYKIVIVTNQSVVGRALITLSDAEQINRQLLQVIRGAGGRIDGVYLCPHRPQDGCSCRKPQPGLILQAAQELSLDLSRSIMIGDAIDDLQAGQAAGIPRGILLLTGRGNTQLALAPTRNLAPFEVFNTLLDAVDNILQSISISSSNPGSLGSSISRI